MATRLARALGLQNVQTSAQLVDKLRTVDATRLYNATVNYDIMVDCAYTRVVGCIYVFLIGCAMF